MQVLANKGPVKPANEGFSAADANKHVKRGSAVSLAAKFEERNKVCLLATAPPQDVKCVLRWFL